MSVSWEPEAIVIAAIINGTAIVWASLPSSRTSQPIETPNVKNEKNLGQRLRAWVSFPRVTVLLILLNLGILVLELLKTEPITRISVALISTTIACTLFYLQGLLTYQRRLHQREINTRTLQFLEEIAPKVLATQNQPVGLLDRLLMPIRQLLRDEDKK